MLLQFHTLLSKLPYYLVLPRGFNVHLLSIVLLVPLVDPLIEFHPPPNYIGGALNIFLLYIPPQLWIDRLFLILNRPHEYMYFHFLFYWNIE